MVDFILPRRTTPFPRCDLLAAAGDDPLPPPDLVHAALAAYFAPAAHEFYRWEHRSGEARAPGYADLGEPRIVAYRHQDAPAARVHTPSLILRTAGERHFARAARHVDHVYTSFPVGDYGDELALLIAAASRRLSHDIETYWSSGRDLEVVPDLTPGTLGAVAFKYGAFLSEPESTLDDSAASVGVGLCLLLASRIPGLDDPLVAALSVLRDRLLDEFALSIPFTFTASMGSCGIGFPVAGVVKRSDGHVAISTELKELLTAEWRQYLESCHRRTADDRREIHHGQEGQRCPGVEMFNGYSAIDVLAILLGRHMIDLAPRYLGIDSPRTTIGPASELA